MPTVSKRLIAVLTLSAIITILGLGCAYADNEYAFSVESTGAFQYLYRGLVHTHGSSLRVTYLPVTDVVLPHSAVLLDNDQRIAINDDTRTWYPLKTGRPNRYIRSVFDFYRASVCRVASADFKYEPTTLVFRLRLVTDIAGTLVRSSIGGQIDVTADERLKDSLPLAQLLSLDTGLPALDTAIADNFSSFVVPLASATVTLTRRLDGGVTTHQTLRVAITEQKVVPDDPSRFTVPGNYQKREPAIGY